MIPALKAPTDLTQREDELIALAAAGQHEAFRTLMRRHNQLLYRTARSILRDDAEAEDVLQDAYLLAYRALGKFRGGARLSTWLVQIVRNEAFSHLHKRTRRAEIFDFGRGPLEDDEGVTQIPNQDDTLQPENMAIRSELRALIESKIDALPESFRTVFMLRAVEEMPADEVAQCLGIPEATVRTRYFRAKGLLREALDSEMDRALTQAHAFDGARCDRIVAAVMARIAADSTGDAKA